MCNGTGRADCAAEEGQARSVSKAGMVHDLMGQGAVPQVLTKKNRTGLVTASGVSQECRSSGEALGTGSSAIPPAHHVQG